MTEDRMVEILEGIRAELKAMRGDMASMRGHLDGMPLLHRNLTNAHQDIRMLRAAFNDFALTNVTKGEIEALHEDVNRVQADNATLAARMETAERLIREIQDAMEHD